MLKAIEVDAKVAEDGNLRLQIPVDIAPGEYRVVLVIDESSKDDVPFELPSDDLGEWPEGLTLSRDQIYDNDR